MSGDRLRVVAATPLAPESARLIAASSPLIDFVYEPSLLRPMRHPADHEGDPAFRRTVEQAERFHAAITSADVLYGIPDSDPRLLALVADENEGLRWVHTMAAGGGAQVSAAGLSPTQLDRITFTTSAGVHAGPLAEFALLGILAGAKGLPRLEEQQRAHEWSSRWLMGQVRRQVVVVVGLGGIGTEVARLLDALGATVIGVSRHPVVVAGVTRTVHPDDLPAIAAVADAVVVALPGTEATRGLIGPAFFKAFKAGGTVVNVGRGTVIDERALVESLKNGTVGFAALDVFEREPLDPASELWGLPNVLVSPHTAALDDSEELRIVELFVSNLGRFLAGDRLSNVVNTVEFY